MLKRGQVTVFIILGIIILATVIGYFILREEVVTEELTQNGLIQSGNVKLFVESCLEQVGTRGLDLIGSQGGYYNLFNQDLFFTTLEPISDLYFNSVDDKLETVQDNFFTIPYYFYQGEDFTIDENTINNELTKYIEDNLDNCLNEFTVFKQQGLIVKEEPYKVKVNFLSNKVQFELDYLLKITEGTQTKEFSKFIVNHKLDFRTVLTVVEEALRKQQKLGNSVIVADLTFLSEIYDFSYEIDYIESSSVVYLFYFEQEKQDDYVFAYAAKYNWDDLEIDDPYLETEPIDYELFEDEEIIV